MDVTLEILSESSLLAVQGPCSQLVLEPLVGGVDLSKLGFMRSVAIAVAGIEGCRVTRCGWMILGDSSY